ncbi:DUF3164 family protein [Asticcacaulis sp. YBE204]|uniref:DUF3164 family protein n=1 Tax=Asticcacaulis sp. YBE204 TaxID=1282363 RepID=UPI0003C3ED3F|nr:DUF3164 family protein [Asticcacaulis sp. YBE204]ESQ78443.1 sulfate transporter [Asticcacaulis sp. YBE204]
MNDHTDKNVFERAAEEFDRHNAELAAVNDVLAEAGLDEGIETIGGVAYMRDTKGRLVPVEQVRPIDKLIDQTVRKIVGYAEPLSAQIARFREHSFDDVDSLLGIVAEQYGVALGGSKGNRTLTTVDGLMQVKVAIADRITFGPELEAAKALVDECLREWTDGARAELRTLVDRAFQVDKEGKINQGELLSLRRLNIDDPRWKKAMVAIDDSIRIIGSKRYVRVYRRANLNQDFQQIVLDPAGARAA